MYHVGKDYCMIDLECMARCVISLRVKGLDLVQTFMKHRLAWILSIPPSQIESQYQGVALQLDQLLFCSLLHLRTN